MRVYVVELKVGDATSYFQIIADGYGLMPQFVNRADADAVVSVLLDYIDKIEDARASEVE